MAGNIYYIQARYLTRTALSNIGNQEHGNISRVTAALWNLEQARIALARWVLESFHLDSLTITEREQLEGIVKEADHA